MAQTWTFLNKTDNPIPEFSIKADDASTQMLLYQISKNFYGNPFVMDATIVNGANLASEILFSFGTPTISSSILDTSINLDNLSVIPSWHNRDEEKTHYRESYVKTYYPYDHLQQFENIGIPLKKAKCIVKNLYMEFPDFDLIKDYSPELLIEKYSHAKGSKKSNRNFSAAGYKPAPLVSSFPIKEKKMIVEFRQEEFFRLRQQGGVNTYGYHAKGYRKLTQVKMVHSNIQFKIRVNINGVYYVTNSLLQLKLMLKAREILIDDFTGDNRIPTPGNNDTLTGELVLSYSL